MTRSLYAIPATLCLAAAVVTAQAPAGDKPASNPPATQQPAGQPPAGQQPSTGKPTTSSPSSQQPSSTMAGNKITYVGCVKPGTSTGTWVLENAEAQKAGATGSGAVGTVWRIHDDIESRPCRDSELEGACEPQGRDRGHDVERVGCHRSRRSTRRRSSSRSDGCDEMQKVKRPSPGPRGGTGTTGGTGAAGARASGHHFSVESLKMVSATCP